MKVKIRLIEDYGNFKSGQEFQTKEEDARVMVDEARVAEYVEEERDDRKKIAKLYRDKHVAETIGINKFEEAYKILGIDPNNIDIIKAIQNKEKLAIKEEVKQETEEEREHGKIKNQFLSYVKDKKFNESSELMVEYILDKNKMFTTKDDIKSEVWIYSDGIYIPQGKCFIKETMREILGNWYSTWHYNQVIAKIEPDTYIESDKFFKTLHKEEIPVQNGVLNIFTKELKEYSPDKVFFNKCPVKYNPEAKCEKIDKFLSEVLANEEDKLVFYELGGLCLLKEYRFEKAFMFVGSGRNGKGKSLELLKRVIGPESCCSIPLTSLIPESFSISELFGKMINLAGDIGSTDLKETSMFKSLTGRDIVSGKRKYLRDIIFENHAKFVFACNELPVVYDMSKGFWDRWVLLEFPYTFETKEDYDKAEDKTNLKIRDENIIHKITTEEELSGLLNKFLEGLHRLTHNKRFSMTKGTEEIKNTWIRKSNSFIAFCMDCVEEDYESKISKKILRKEYSKFCKKHEVPSKSDFVVKKVLQDMYGVVDERDTNFNQTEWVWQGIKLKINKNDKL